MTTRTPHEELRREMALEEAKRAHESAQGKKTHQGNFEAESSATGLLNRLRDFANAVAEVTQPLFSFAMAVGKPLYRVGKATTLFCARHTPGAVKVYWHLMATKKDKKTGERHFNGKRLLLNLGLSAALTALTPTMIAGLYYHGTLESLDNVYIPSAAVFVGQQFVNPNSQGTIAPRDEIFTIMGSHVSDDGLAEPIRFDIDSNLFFPETYRPDQLAAMLNSQSSLGVKCKVKVTGIYSHLPRKIRMKALKWLDLRPEIVAVENVEQLVSMPSFVKIAPPGPGDIPAGFLPVKGGHPQLPAAPAP